ncbi:MAG: response regulator [Nocardioidaceae bacterium]
MELPEETYRGIAESAPAGLWVLDADGRTVSCNPRAAEMLGRPGTRLTGMLAADLVDEAERADFEAQLRSALDGATGDELTERRFRCAEGSTRWLLVSTRRVPGEGGRPLVVLWLNDMTRREELYQQVLDQREELTDAQSLARTASWRLELASQEVTWSDAMYDLLGRDGSLAPLTIAEFVEGVVEQDRHVIEQATEDVLRTGRMEAEVRYRRPDGRVIWLRSRGAVRPDGPGRSKALLSTLHDVTHQKQTESELFEALVLSHLQRSRASDANDSSTVAVALDRMFLRALELDPDIRLLTFHPGVDEDGGATLAARFPGRDYTGVAVGQDVPTERELRCARKVLASREVSITEYDDGTVEMAHAFVYEGDVFVVVVITTENTFNSDENRRAILETVGAQLARVKERERTNAELAATRDAALEASRHKSAFLATMSHEIRTPLNGVIGLNDLLLGTDLDSNQRRITEGVQAAGRSLLAVINDILDFSKIEAGKLELESVDFDLREVSDRAASLLGERAHERGIELAVSIRPDVPPYLRGDPTRLSQILTNLLSNAVKFTSEGEVIVFCDLVEATADDVRLRFEVSDTGTGIAGDRQHNLFDAFSQAEMSTTREFGGSGLGLAICRQLVTALGGEIGVTSELGKGSTFWFTAGFRIGSPVTVEPSTERAHVLVGRRALVVDDNASNRRILAELLTEWRVDVEQAVGAIDALGRAHAAALRGEPFDVVLLDLVMPEHDGLELAAMISDSVIEPRPRMLLLSSAQHVDRHRVEQAGISLSLTKPVGRSALFDGLVDSLADLHGVEAVTRAPSRPPAERTGKHLLLVEDNEINQMVALGVLESLGYTADVAADGEEAVRMVGRTPYDGVLMDVQMPRMDGYTATRTIRAAEPDGAHVPIIAMTAAAIEGERERCLASGMDDFLTKPLEPERLEATLHGWLLTSPDGPAGDPPPTVVLDPSRLETLREMGPRAESLVDRIITGFTTQAPQQVAAIRAAVERDDATELGALAHKLFGSAANLGAVRVADLCADLERLADDGVAAGAADLLPPLEAAMAATVAALRG